MNILFGYMLAVGGLLLLCLIPFTVSHEDEYLKVIGYDWKCGQVARDELSKRHDRIIFSFVFYEMMKRLVHNDLVECRPVVSLFHPYGIVDYEYRRKCDHSHSLCGEQIPPRRRKSLPQPICKTAGAPELRRSFFV